MNQKQKSAYKKSKRAEAEAEKVVRKATWKAYCATHLVHLGNGVFYNDLVDADKFDIENREQRISNNDLPNIEHVDALAEFLSLTLPEMRWLAYHRDATKNPHYKQFTIPKSDGSERVISAPRPKLKKAQHTILHKILDRMPIHGAAHGFVPGRSIASHADKHAGRKIVVKMDLKDFFPTLTFPRVKGLFRKIGYPEQVATVMALICTEPKRKEVEHDGEMYHVSLSHRSLPQGAPTSPTITNIVCMRLDRRMSGLAKKLGWSYSRYADDLVFSTNDTDINIGALLRLSEKVIRAEGFRRHPKKTHVMRQCNRQKVTGLIVNPTPSEEKTTSRVPRKVVRQVKAGIYNRLNGKPHKSGESLEQLRGLAAFINQTNPTLGRKFLDQIKTLVEREENEI